MMLVDRDGHSAELRVSLAQLKKIYVALFRQLHERGAAALDDIDDDDMLLTIQTYLQRRARQEGVDCTIHADWEKFLGIVDAPSCAQRFAQRRE